MIKTITIARREEKTINGRDILNIWDTNGTRYTHFIDPENEGWDETLQEGETVQVYVTEKPNKKNPKYPYRNIYMPRDGEEGALLTKSDIDDIFDKADDNGGKLVATDEKDKSERIRWMNSLNNACRLVQGQVVPIDEMNPMKSIVQLANVFYKLEPQR
jgi:hypothetical protein